MLQMLHFGLMSLKFSPGFFLHVQYSIEALWISFTGFSVVSSRVVKTVRFL